MDLEIKTQWVAALRSGDYKQGKGVLCRETPEGRRTYCCLGVLSDLAEKAGIVSTRLRKVEYDGTNEVHYGDGIAFPDLDVVEWAGLETDNPIVPYDLRNEKGVVIANRESLASLNDGQELTFDQIADLIEEYL